MVPWDFQWSYYKQRWLHTGRWEITMYYFSTAGGYHYLLFDLDKQILKMWSYQPPSSVLRVWKWHLHVCEPGLCASMKLTARNPTKYKNTLQSNTKRSVNVIYRHLCKTPQNFHLFNIGNYESSSDIVDTAWCRPKCLSLLLCRILLCSFKTYICPPLLN